MKIWSRVCFVVPSLNEECSAGVDCQGEEREEHAEQLDVGNPSGGLHNVNLEFDLKLSHSSQKLVIHVGF